MTVAFDPWRHVDADDDLVADLLAGTVEAVVDVGGWIHPQVRFVVSDGQTHVECDAPEGEPLLRVPTEAFIRVDRVQWSDSADSLEFAGIPGGFTSTQVELLVLQTAFHNACGKMPWITRTHPMLADLTDEAVASVRAIQPGFRSHVMTPTEVFWSTRAFRMAVDEAEPSEKVVVPLVDLLDHDHRGATGTWTGDAFEVAITQPLGTAECRLDYGHDRDVIEMAIVYGFVDEGCPRAHSAPNLDQLSSSELVQENIRLLDDLVRCAEADASDAGRTLAQAARLQSRIHEAGRR